MSEGPRFLQSDCPWFQEIGALEEVAEDVNGLGEFGRWDKGDCDGYVRRPAGMGFIVDRAEDVEIVVEVLGRQNDDCCCVRGTCDQRVDVRSLESAS
jgi:hypothetical protein